MTPMRIQLRRRKGWRMPANTAKVDRTTKWGNPFVAGKHGTQAECVYWHRVMLCGYICLTSGPGVEPQQAYNRYARRYIKGLKGKNLACWCRLCHAHAAGKPFGVECEDCAPCHADTLLEAANLKRNKSARCADTAANRFTT
jgi:hypothetical protein